MILLTICFSAFFLLNLVLFGYWLWYSCAVSVICVPCFNGIRYIVLLVSDFNELLQ